MEPTYRLEGIIRSKEEMEDFEGPLNLILMLLSKNKIEIRDLQIAEILDQYMDYLAQMERMDLEVTSEFIQMASHLLYIKTKMLLTQEEEVSELELLMQSLEQLRAKDVYSALKEITPELSEMSERGMLCHVKPPEPIKVNKEYCYSHEPVELLKAINTVLSRGRTKADEETGGLPRRRIVPQRITYSVRDKSGEILTRFRGKKFLLLSELYSESSSRSEIVATFLSLLELCSKGQIHLDISDDDISISFCGDSIDDAIENISE